MGEGHVAPLSKLQQGSGAESECKEVKPPGNYEIFGLTIFS